MEFFDSHNQEGKHSLSDNLLKIKQYFIFIRSCTIDNLQFFQLFPLYINMMSSGKTTTLPYVFNVTGSSMYCLKKSGPKTVPCDTSQVTVRDKLFAGFKSTICERPAK